MKSSEIPKPETVVKMQYVPQGGNWKDIPKDIFSYGPHTHSDIMRRLSYDEIAPTITNVRKNKCFVIERNHKIINAGDSHATVNSGGYALSGKISGS